MSTNNTKPDWSQVKLSNQYNWTDGVSSNGTQFKVGTTSSGNPPQAQGQVSDLQLNAVATSSKQSFDIQVNWQGRPPPEGFTPINQPTPEETRITSITSWILNTAPLSFNEFTFTCTEAYNFYFFDATGDSYQCNVFWPRSGTTHVIWYFSSNPTIVRITGS